MFTNPLQKLFPTPQDNYGGLLDPQAIQGAQQQQLLRFAAGLLGRTSGYSPTEAIGQAFNDLPDWNQVLHGMVGQRIALRDAQRKMEVEANRKDILQQYPLSPGATELEIRRWLWQVFPKFIGDPEMLGRLGEVLKSAAGNKIDYQNMPGRIPAGQPNAGQGAVFRVPEVPGAPAERIPGIEPFPKVPVGRGALKQIPGPNGPQWAVFNPETQDFEPTGENAITTEAQARAIVQAPLADRSLQRVRTLATPDRIQQIVAEGGWNEFLQANAERLQRNIRIIADAYARTLTGAAMRQEEWENAKLVMTPQAGDDPETVVEKLKDVELMVKQLYRIGGFSSSSKPEDAVPPKAPAKPSKATLTKPPWKP